MHKLQVILGGFLVKEHPTHQNAEVFLKNRLKSLSR
jgi:hypothetical protein